MTTEDKNPSWIKAASMPRWLWQIEQPRDIFDAITAEYARPNPTGDELVQRQYAEQLAQSLDDDEACEGYNVKR